MKKILLPFLLAILSFNIFQQETQKFRLIQNNPRQTIKKEVEI